MGPRKASGSSSSSSSSSAAGPSKPRSAKTTTVIATSSASSSKPRPSSAIVPPGPNDRPSTDAHLGLLIEYLTYNPRAFIDALVWAANNDLYKLGEDFEANVLQLLKQQTEVDDPEREAEQGTHSIRTLIENALDHTFDTLELYSLSNVFGLTPRQASHMVLPHHAGLDLRGRRPGQEEDESTELSRRQRELNSKLNAARATSHALKLAVEASDRRLIRTRAVHSTLLQLTGGIDGDAEGAVEERAIQLLEAVRVVKAERAPLLSNIEKLRAVDPLGQALIHPTSKLPGGDDGAEGEAEDQPWASGREGYLRWQTQRMMASSRRSMGGPTVGEGDTTMGDASSLNLKPSSQGRKRKSGAAAIGGRASGGAALSSQDDGIDGEEVGKTAELEKLANLMHNRGTATTAPVAMSAPSSSGRKSKA